MSLSPSNRALVAPLFATLPFLCLGGCYLFHSPDVAHGGPSAPADAAPTPGRRDAAAADSARPLPGDGCEIESCGPYSVSQHGVHLHFSRRGECGAVPSSPSIAGVGFRIVEVASPTSISFVRGDTSRTSCTVVVDGLPEEAVTSLLSRSAPRPDLYCLSSNGGSLMLTWESATDADPDDCLDGLRFYAHDDSLDVVPVTPLLRVERADTLCSVEPRGEVFSVRIGDSRGGALRWWGPNLEPGRDATYGRGSAHAWLLRAHTPPFCAEPVNDVLPGTAAIVVIARDISPFE